MPEINEAVQAMVDRQLTTDPGGEVPLDKLWDYWQHSLNIRRERFRWHVEQSLPEEAKIESELGEEVKVVGVKL